MSTSQIKKIALLAGFVIALIIFGVSIYFKNRPKADIAETNKQIDCLNLLKQVAIQDDDVNRINLLNQVLSFCPTNCDSEIRAYFSTFQSTGLDESAKLRRRQERRDYIEMVFKNGSCRFR